MQKLTAILPDVLVVAGAAALSFGAWLLHPAAGFITAGVLMLAGGALAALNGQRSKVVN
jgi:hypothetical protein